MSPKKRRRLAFAVALVIAGIGAAAMVLYALKDNVLYFYSPSDVAARQIHAGVAFRVGGLVMAHSVARGPGAEVRFTVTDGKSAIPVRYRGVLPALFREGQGVVVLGSLDDRGVFVAAPDGVLAKHDEKYMPPEVVDALKRAGRWKEGQ